MTKKKRLRKEQHHQRGNTPPAQVTPPLDPWDDPIGQPPANLRFLDETAGDDLDAELDALEAELLDSDDLLSQMEQPDPEYQLRPMERGMMRIQRYLERKGIVVTPENETEVEDLLAEGEWQREPEVLNTPLDRAQALIYDAFELPDDQWQQKSRLAKEALKISHNCADAHTLMAELEPQSDAVALKHSIEAVKAAERAFADIDVTAHPRDFWFLFKLRPLLRALASRATNEAIAGHTEKEADAYRRLFEIDHLDVMERRDLYVATLAELGRDQELLDVLESLGWLDRLSDESDYIQYTVALARYRLEGDSETARAALRAALAGNPLIARYMLGAERVQYDILLLASLDDPKAAAEYYTNGLRFWLNTPNAIEWLRANAG